MAYSLFCTDGPNPSANPPAVRRVVPVNSDSLGAAINAACKLIGSGAIVWKLKGPDGFLMERRDIETECRRRKAGKP